MQVKPADTPKIIALIVMIVVVFGVAFWRILSVTHSSSGPASTAATTNPTSGVLQTASSSTAPTPDAVGPGMVRRLTALDEPTADQMSSNGAAIPIGRSDAFHVPIAPPPTPTVPVFTHPTITTGPDRMPTRVFTQPEFRQPVVPIPPRTEAIKVEGVVAGPGGFAMLTQDGTTFYKRTGTSVLGYQIVRMTENGVTVRKGSRRMIWPIGEVVQVPVPGIAPQPSAPGTLNVAPISPDTGRLPNFDTVPAEQGRNSATKPAASGSRVLTP